MKKNLYLLALLLSIGSSAVAQVNENSNWVFGYQSGLRFLPISSPPTSISSTSSVLANSCTVSDENGDLLFYTDGKTVWNSTFSIITNGTGLFGNSHQGVIIIPKSIIDKTYYVVTLDGYENTHAGFHYSEVDMSNGFGEVIAATKNTVLKDASGTDINPLYFNRGQKITATTHSNGVDYWLVAQIGSSIYSYLVTATGISIMPDAVTAAPVDVNLPPPNQSENGPGIGAMKISPDTHHFATTYCDNAFFGDLRGALLTGTFDNSTGYISLDPLIMTTEENFWGLDFSANSQYIYFSAQDNIYQAHVNNTAALTSIYTLYSDPGMYFQRAVNGKIYIGHPRGDIPYSNLLHVINDPDNFSTPDLQFFSQYAPGFPGLCLPQLVPIQPDCEQYIVLSNPDGNSAPFTYSYSDYIVDNQNYTVDNGQNITQKAGNFISIEPDTYIKPGSLFLAEITPCTGTKGDIKGKAARPVADSPGLKISSDLLVYPNPAKGSVNIAINSGTLSQVTITSLSGQVLYDAAAAAQNNISVNVSNYAAGIYFVSAKTNEGKQFTQKLVVE